MKVGRLVALSIVSLVFAGCSGPTANGQQQQATQTPIIFQNGVNLTPTPTFPPYTAGAWVSNSSPATSGTVALYAKFLNNTAPVPNVPAVVTFNTPSGAHINLQPSTTVKTGSDGTAEFTLVFDNLPLMHPITINVSFTYNGQVYSCSTFISALTAATPTATPPSAAATP